MNILDIKRELSQEIELFFFEKYAKRIFAKVQIPELAFGDVMTNVCLQESKELSVSPLALAEELKKYLENKCSSYICLPIDIKGPGFLNFFIKKEVLRGVGKKTENSLFEKIQNVFFPTRQNIFNSKYFGQKILVEHSSPNLFKPFTIGHLMNNFTGEFLVRLMQYAGGSVTAISFPSDISIGIAKAVYIIKKDGGLKEEIFKKSSGDLVKYLGESYVRGVELYKKAESENENIIVREVKDVANNLYANTGSADLDIYNFTKTINVKYLFDNLENLGSKFDGFIFESESGVEGKNIVLENTPNIFTKSEGAIVYVPAEERKDLNTFVFINSEGNPTYEAKDIGLLALKFKKYNPDFSFFVTDNEQGPHFKVILDAAGKINKSWEEKSIFIPHGRMSFKGQRMSSRLGGVPTAQEVVDTVLENVKELSKERNVSEKIKKEIAMSALRISVLKSKPGINIDFDPEKALSFVGDSGPYLCYTSARLHSLLEKGKEKNLFPGARISQDGNEKKLERKIYQFESVMSEVIEEIAPQKLVTYLFELSGEFNSFYNDNQILSEDILQSEHYLYVIKKTLRVLKEGLHILGISAPESM